MQAGKLTALHVTQEELTMAALGYQHEACCLCVTTLSIACICCKALSSSTYVSKNPFAACFLQ